MHRILINDCRRSNADPRHQEEICRSVMYGSSQFVDESGEWTSPTQHRPTNYCQRDSSTPTERMSTTNAQGEVYR